MPGEEGGNEMGWRPGPSTRTNHAGPLEEAARHPEHTTDGYRIHQPGVSLRWDRNLLGSAPLPLVRVVDLLVYAEEARSFSHQTSLPALHLWEPQRPLVGGGRHGHSEASPVPPNVMSNGSAPKRPFLPFPPLSRHYGLFVLVTHFLLRPASRSKRGGGDTSP